MYQVETFSVWIYDENNGEDSHSRETQTNYIFSEDRPCGLPKSGFVHITVRADETKQHIASLEGEYFYGPKLHDVLIAKYSAEELSKFENNIAGSGSFLNRIVSAVNALTPYQREDLVCKFGVPCFGSLTATLGHLLILQLAILLLFIAWIDSPCFWKNKLLPLYVKFPPVENFVNRRLLKLIAIYIAYLFSTHIHLELKPILNTILCFINTWDQVLIEGCPIDSDFFFAQLNLGFIKAVVWQIEDGDNNTDILTCDEDVVTRCHRDGVWRKKITKKESSCESFVTGDSIESCDKQQDFKRECKSIKCDSDVSSFVTTDDFGADIYHILESKKGEVEKRANQANKSLASHFSTLSHEVVAYAMTEVRRRLEGCVEDTIYKSYPRIENYIQSALNEKSNYFFLLKEQLELEVSRVREVCQQAFLVLEAVPQYEERIKHLENEVKLLKAERNGDTDLHRKVAHLQSTVTQLLKAVRVRA